MPKIKYHVHLSKKERITLLDIVSKDSASARSIMRANVLLAADENSPNGKKSENEIAELFNVHQQTVHTIRKEYSEKGLDAALSRKSVKRHQWNLRLQEKSKQKSLLLVAVPLPQDDPDGLLGYWQISQLNCSMLTVYPTRR